MTSQRLISSNIERFYNEASEETRLEEGMGVFEFERVKHLIAKHLPDSPSLVLDVGGGTGKYSAWLAEKGHQVHLVEPLAKHLKIAQNRAKKLKQPFTVHTGESRALDFPNQYADVIILHGPLYHLQCEEDRRRTIQEAKRVLKKGGIILAFAINYTASTLAGLMNGLIFNPSFFEMCKQELTTGIHNPPCDFPRLLAEAFYHKPKELKSEFEDQALTYLNTYAVEGMAWLDTHFFSNLFNINRKRRLWELLEITESDPYLLPFSPHMMIAVKKKSHE